MSALDTIAARQASLDSLREYADAKHPASEVPMTAGEMTDMLAAQRRAALLEAAQIAFDMFEASGKTPARCGCGQCIAVAIKRKAEEE